MIYDVIVVGGGPAGMMAAGRAAELGARVVLLEKNKSLGRKLLMTGNGRCNVVQAEFNDKALIKRLGSNGKFLFSSLSAFGPEEVMIFFKKRGLELKTERGKRVFPVTDKSRDVLEAIMKYLRENKVKIMNNSEVIGFEFKNQKIESLKLKDKIIYAKNYILCTGGKSYPATGSTGDGYQWAKQMGHQIINTNPALVPIKTKEKWVKGAQGLSLKNVQINIIQNGKKQESIFGEMLFTHFGLSGPIILDVSKKIGELLNKGQVLIEIDLKPALDSNQLDKRLQRDFGKNSKKDFKNYLPKIIPKKLIDIVINLSGIDSKRKVNSISREERRNLVNLLKGIRLTVENLMGYDQAIITSGGISLKEIDPKTMRSKIIENLFLAGEIIDLDGPSGGYNLQICWSTGYVAGTHAAF